MTALVPYGTFDLILPLSLKDVPVLLIEVSSTDLISGVLALSVTPIVSCASATVVLDSILIGMQAFSAAVANSDGDSASGPGTHQGFHALQKRTNALTRSVADILISLTTERRRFGKLHNGWRVMGFPPGQSST